MDNLNMFPFVNKGWQCPICGRVYAPTTPMCFYCGNSASPSFSTKPADLNIPKNGKSGSYTINPVTEETDVSKYVMYTKNPEEECDGGDNSKK